jgi:hypothetical protein
VGTFYVLVGSAWVAGKLVRLADGVLDAVSLGGNVPFGAFSTLRICTTLKSGAATRRLIEAGELSHGRMNYLPARWLVSAKASEFVGVGAWLTSRYGPEGWVIQPEQLAMGQLLLAEVQAIEAQEVQAQA